jgi:integrase
MHSSGLRHQSEPSKSNLALDAHNLRRTARREQGIAAGIGHVTPEMLRKSLATAYADARVERRVAASITGHSPAVYDNHYAKAHRTGIALSAKARCVEVDAPRPAGVLRRSGVVGSCANPR